MFAVAVPLLLLGIALALAPSQSWKGNHHPSLILSTDINGQFFHRGRLVNKKSLHDLVQTTHEQLKKPSYLLRLKQWLDPKSKPEEDLPHEQFYIGVYCPSTMKMNNLSPMLERLTIEGILLFKIRSLPHEQDAWSLANISFIRYPCGNHYLLEEQDPPPPPDEGAETWQAFETELAAQKKANIEFHWKRGWIKITLKPQGASLAQGTKQDEVFGQWPELAAEIQEKINVGDLKLQEEKFYVRLDLDSQISLIQLAELQQNLRSLGARHFQYAFLKDSVRE